MPIVSEEWETKSNLEAQGSSIRGREQKQPNLEVIEGGASQQPQASMEESEEDPDDPGLSKGEILTLIKNAHQQGVSYQQTILQPRWNASYLAFNNKHTSDSKYSTPRWRGRTRLFRPKTRGTARKKSAEAAAALFSTSDVVLVSPQNPGDKLQQASAAIIHELLNFRLDRSSENAGIPWFMTAMGAHLTATQTSCCISKQYWEYKQEFVGWEDVEVEQPLDLQALGLDQIEGIEPMPVIERRKKFKTVKDKPVIRLYPPEDVIKDPGADWTNQSQDSSYLILKNPMALREAREFLKSNNEHSALQFIELLDADLWGAAGASQGDSGTAANVRRSREVAGNDRYSDQAVDLEFRTVWLHENFMRINDKDFVFWTLGIDKLVSNIVPVSKAYPEQGGARPVTIGVATIEPFKIDPMSPIESWQPLQQEINDLVNLSLDATKQGVSPLTLVKRGRSVDIKAIQNRSPDTVAYVQDVEDVKFDRPGGPSPESHVAMERMNADFDDLAGNFSIGSVQTNRALGDTVGGMKMMTNNANAMGEYDLRVWIETWVEVALRQLVKLIQYYESDENVIAVAAGKAKLLQKFNVDAITNQMLTSQVVIICNVGLGSADPMLGLQKFGEAAKIAGGIIGVEQFQKRVKADEIINEVFGKAGYKDASERFFNKAAEEDPRLAEAQQVIQQMQGALGEAENAVKDKSEDRASKERITDKNNANAVKLKKMDIFGKVIGDQMGHQNTLQQQQVGHEQGMEASEQGAILDQQGAEQEAALNPPVGPGAARQTAPGAEGDGEAELLQVFSQMQQAKTDAGMQQAQVIAQAMQQSNAALAQAMAQSNKMMLMGFEALIAKIDAIGGEVTATMEKIAAAPREIIRGADDRATGVKLKLAGAA